MTKNKVINNGIIEKYNKIDVACCKAYEKYNELSKQRYKLHQEMKKFVLSNKLYLSMDELKNFKEEELRKITLIMSNDDTRDFWSDDIMEVDKDGYFKYSSLGGGIFEWNEAKQKYDGAYNYHEADYDVVGFIDIEFEHNSFRRKNEELEVKKRVLEERSTVNSIVSEYFENIGVQ